MGTWGGHSSAHSAAEGQAQHPTAGHHFAQPWRGAGGAGAAPAGGPVPPVAGRVVTAFAASPLCVFKDTSAHLAASRSRKPRQVAALPSEGFWVQSGIGFVRGGWGWGWP